jgi:hypothetical protein
VDVDGHILYFALKGDLNCHVNHHHLSHLSSPPIIQPTNHSSGTAVSLVGGCNLDDSSCSGAASKWAASKFLPNSLNQAAPVQSSASCPPAWIEIHDVSPSDTWHGGLWSDTPIFVSTTPQNHATYCGSESGSEEDK